MPRMSKWRIAWTQVVGDAGELHHVDEVEAPNAIAAISRWCPSPARNARAEAVWRVGSGRFWRKRKGGNGLGDNIAENGTCAGDGRRMPEWVTRAKLVRYWRHAMQVAGTMTRADLESAFACEYTSRWKAELECDRLRKKGGV